MKSSVLLTAFHSSGVPQPNHSQLHHGGQSIYRGRQGPDKCLHCTEKLRKHLSVSIRACLFSSACLFIVTVFCFPKKFWKLPKLLQRKNKTMNQVGESGSTHPSTAHVPLDCASTALFIWQCSSLSSFPSLYHLPLILGYEGEQDDSKQRKQDG